ncbi:hypothetical protein BUC_3793 [Burkholderia pseudomallei 576]|nr:hypothetical protein BUC_3793 [Burkholderia pseudomallei 576]
MREENLRGADPVFGKPALVYLREPHLPDGRGRLQLVDLARPLAPTEALHAFRDRARADEHHFLARAAQRGDLGGPSADGVMIEPAAVVGDEARAHFHYQALRIGDDRTHRALSP